MDLYSHLQRLFQYDDWANREVVAALEGLPAAPPKAVRLMAHVVATEFVWLVRLKGQPDPAVWPDWNTKEISQQRQTLAAAMGDYLQSITADRLADSVTYTNTKGQRWTNSVADILMHITMHSTYHRGQIAMVLRDAGVTPPYTDYIQAVRMRRITD